jgi:hypothetical protein
VLDRRFSTARRSVNFRAIEQLLGPAGASAAQIRTGVDTTAAVAKRLSSSKKYERNPIQLNRIALPRPAWASEEAIVVVPAGTPGRGPPPDNRLDSAGRAGHSPADFSDKDRPDL